MCILFVPAGGVALRARYNDLGQVAFAGSATEYTNDLVVLATADVDVGAGLSSLQGRAMGICSL